MLLNMLWSSGIWYHGRGGNKHMCACQVQLWTLWTIAHQAPLSVDFSRQEYWCGLPFPSPGDLLASGIEHRSRALQWDSLPSEPPVKPLHTHILNTDLNTYSSKSFYLTSYLCKIYLQSCSKLQFIHTHRCVVVQCMNTWPFVYFPYFRCHWVAFTFEIKWIVYINLHCNRQHWLGITALLNLRDKDQVCCFNSLPQEARRAEGQWGDWSF